MSEIAGNLPLGASWAARATDPDSGNSIRVIQWPGGAKAYSINNGQWHEMPGYVWEEFASQRWEKVTSSLIALFCLRKFLNGDLPA